MSSASYSWIKQALHVSAGVAIVGWLVGPSLVAAAAARPVPVEERIRGAARVVVAHAQTVNARWQQNAFGDRLIVSRVQLQVEETLKGTPRAEVAMDIEGGTLDGFTLRVSSLPVIEQGHRGVFFLDETSPNTFAPHLRGQGILELDETDTVRGSSLHLESIRGLARGLAR